MSDTNNQPPKQPHIVKETGDFPREKQGTNFPISIGLTPPFPPPPASPPHPPQPPTPNP